LIEHAGQGIDTVYTHLNYTLGAHVENLTLTGADAVTGTGNELDNVLTGNAANNTLHGLEGNDTLNGGAGADTMFGGTGNDTYVVDDTGDQVIEQADEGIDTVRSTITYTLTDNVENLTLTGSANIDGTGNELDNVLAGNAGNNVLAGLAGNDTYVVSHTGHTVVEQAGEGVDTVESSISYTLGANVENLTLTGWANINGTGNELDNVIIGNAGHNVLDGGAGADVMRGGYGNDTYLLDDLGDVVQEEANQGTDTVVAPFDYTLGANVENLTLTGSALTGTGNGLNNVLVGNANDNTLLGLGATTPWTVVPVPTPWWAARVTTPMWWTTRKTRPWNWQAKGSTRCWPASTGRWPPTWRT